MPLKHPLPSSQSASLKYARSVARNGRKSRRTHGVDFVPANALAVLCGTQFENHACSAERFSIPTGGLGSGLRVRMFALTNSKVKQWHSSDIAQLNSEHTPTGFWLLSLKRIANGQFYPAPGGCMKRQNPNVTAQIMFVPSKALSDPRPTSSFTSPTSPDSFTTTRDCSTQRM